MDTGAGIGLFQAIYTTRALRRLRSDPLPDETLFQLIDAAIRAPSGQNAQDWRFVLVTEPQVKRRMQAWSEEAWNAYAERAGNFDSLPRSARLSLKSTRYLAQHLAEAPTIVAVCGRRGRHGTAGGSTFPAVQNLLLAARALGLGASIFNFPLTRYDELADALAVPGDYQLYALIALGYPIDKHGPVTRKPVKRVTSLNRWGETWPFAEEQPDEGWTAKWVGKED